MAGFDDFFFTYQSLVYSLGINGLLGLSMYVVLAVGQLSLGQAAFMGLGAYTSALLTLRFGAPLPVGIAGAVVVPALAALLIGLPTFRLSGVYLALATIGLGEMLRLAFLNFEWTGSALGLSGLARIDDYPALYWIFGMLAVALLVAVLITRSRIGRAMEAMREDETAAATLGVQPTRYKLGALVASAVLAGLAGAFEAHTTTFITPGTYGFDAAVTILSFALLGGLGSPFGPVFGALVLTLLPEVMRPLAAYRGVIDGVIIVIAVLYLPRGVLAWRMRRIGTSLPRTRPS